VSARIERVVTSGTFELDGRSWPVDNNVWLVGDDNEVLVIDAAHDADAIATAVGVRRVVAIVCTHAHSDHINAAAELTRLTNAPTWLHQADSILWEMVYPEHGPARWIEDGAEFEVAGETLHVLHTPGHSPGSVSLHAPGLGSLLSGDTLFNGGPGATGRSHSDFPTIIESINRRLLTLPPETVVYTGHGEMTTIGGEAPHLEEWIARGH